MGLNFQEFCVLERQSKEAIVTKKLFIDLCDDLASGMLLSQIVYWFDKGKDGSQRSKIIHNGRHCIIKRRYDWWEECRISAKQYDRAIGILKDLGFVSVETHRSPLFNGEIASYIFMNEEVLMCSINEFLNPKTDSANQINDKQGGNTKLPDGEKQNSPKGENKIDQPGICSIYNKDYSHRICEREDTPSLSFENSSSHGKSGQNGNVSSDKNSVTSQGSGPATEVNLLSEQSKINANDSYKACSDRLAHALEVKSTSDNGYGVASQSLTSPSKNHKKKSSQVPKIEFKESVFLTQEEYKKLIELYKDKPDKFLWMLDKLSAYKNSNGKSYESDYHVLLPANWVNDQYEKDQKEKLKSSRGGSNGNFGNNHQNFKDDMRKRQLDSWEKVAGNPNDNPNIKKYTRDKPNTQETKPSNV